MYAKIRHPERPFVLHVFCKVDPREMSKKLNRIKSKNFYFPADFFDVEDKNDEALTHDLSETIPAHFCLQFPSYPDVGTIAHEVFHVVAMHMRYVNIPLQESSEETYAYMFSWLVGEVYKKIENAKKRDKG